MFDSDSGLVQSPNAASAADPYANDLECQQLIRVAAGQHVLLSFSILSLESDPKCKKDFVAVRVKEGGMDIDFSI